MTLVAFTVPITSSAQDNNSVTAKVPIMVKDCASFGGGGEDCDGWNFNRCPNDNSYSQPFIQGDLIYGQVKYDQNKYTLGTLEVINTATGNNFLNVSFLTSNSGTDALNNAYYNYILNTASSLFDSVKCFYAKLTLLGIGEEADIEIFTEPYGVVQCNEPTLLITGEYPDGYDCAGNYYGALTHSPDILLPIFLPSFRVRGVLEPDEFDMEKTVDENGKTLKSKQTERFILALKGIPYYVAQQIAVCFNSKSTKIDGVEYAGAIKIQKNFEEGSMWYVKETIYLECEEKNYTCE